MHLLKALLYFSAAGVMLVALICAIWMIISRFGKR